MEILIRMEHQVYEKSCGKYKWSIMYLMMLLLLSLLALDDDSLILLIFPLTNDKTITGNKKIIKYEKKKTNWSIRIRRKKEKQI